MEMVYLGSLFSFPELKTDDERTRIILFATDNVVSGTETISLEDACTLCKQYKVNLYAYCPSVQINKFTSTQKINSYKNAVESNAGGKFYTGNLEEMSSEIINEIKDTKTSAMKTTKKTYITDHPQVFFVSFVVIFFFLVIIEKRIRL